MATLEELLLKKKVAANKKKKQDTLKKLKASKTKQDNKGAKGDAGKSIKGDRGDSGESIRGPKGDRGDSIKGDKGDPGIGVQGIQGIDGLGGDSAPTIESIDITDKIVTTTLSDGTTIEGDVSLKLPKTIPEAGDQLRGIHLQRFIQIFSTDGTVTVTKTNTGFDLSVAGNDSFIEHPDTPTTYTSQSLKVLRVNAGETAVEFFDISTTEVDEGTNLYFTDERAQDAVGTILVDTATINFTYNDGTPSIVADVLPAGVDHDLLLNFTQTEHFTEASIDHANIVVGDTNTDHDDRLNTHVGALAPTTPSTLQAGRTWLDTDATEPSAGQKAISQKTGAYTVVSGDEIVVWLISSTALVTLPTASTVTGETFWIVNKYTSTANLTFSVSLDGDSVFELKPGESISIVSDGTEYIVFA